MKPAKILLSTDLSQESERAFAPVVELAKTFGASLCIVHVVEDLPITPHGAPLAPPVHSPSLELEQAEARKHLDEQTKILEETGVPFEKVVIAGPSVSQAVVDYADGHDCDLIALSSHGRSGFKRFFMGSVAELILRHAHVPVLVFPRQK